MPFDAFKNLKVLITGHTGFKGSWLARWLVKLGAEVSGYALPAESKPSLFQILNLEKNIDHYEGDIRDLDSLSQCFKKTQPEIVFHLAAQPLVRDSYFDPVKTYSTNVMGTVNLFECVRQTDSVRGAINVTTDKCYENKEWLWGYRENDPMGGHDPYSSSKGCSELISSAYSKSYFSADSSCKSKAVVASARAGNVIGGGDWSKDRLVPDCVRALVEQKEIIIRNPNAIRPWQHVLEPLSGYMLLANKILEFGDQYSGAWNFGPSDSDTWTVLEAVNYFCAQWGVGEIRIQNSDLHEAGLLKLDSSKSRSLLGWNSGLDTKTAISHTVEWYKLFYGGANISEMIDMTDSQITEYINNV